MSDRELLELAAKAAGYVIVGWNEFDQPLIADADGDPYAWCPNIDDGDALRLAVKLKIHINWGGSLDGQMVYADDVPELIGDDPYAATRRAIVRAATEIGKPVR